MKVHANSIEDFINNCGEKKKDIIKLDNCITENAHSLKRYLFVNSSITMIGYGEMTWKNKANDLYWPIIGIAPQKSHISIYIAAEKQGNSLIEIYKEKLGKINFGKKCIRVKDVNDLSMEEFQALILDAVKWNKTKLV